MVKRKIIYLTLVALFALVLIPATAYANDSEHIPMVNDDFSFEIPYIAPGEVMLIGRIVLEPGVIYSRTISAETNQGNILIGLSPYPNEEGWIGQPRGAWNHWLDLRTASEGQWNFDNDESITAYVYLVSGSSNHRFGRATIIAGRISA